MHSMKEHYILLDSSLKFNEYFPGYLTDKQPRSRFHAEFGLVQAAMKEVDKISKSNAYLVTH